MEALTPIVEVAGFKYICDQESSHGAKPQRLAGLN